MDLLTALPARQGHFLLESGYHSDLWLTLDGLFAEPARVAPLVAALAEKLRPYEAAAVCGPLVGGAFLAQALAVQLGVTFYYATPTPPSGDGLFAATYALPPALASAARGQRVAVVDDAISAGSSVRATCESLDWAGATVVVVGSFLVLGGTGAQYFAERGVPIETLSRRDFTVWPRSACPLCARGAPLERP